MSAAAGASAAIRTGASKPWVWSFIAAGAVLIATVAFRPSGQTALGLITAALTFGTFFTLASIGQMFVVTLGPGNVDLSIPATMTLAGTVAMKAMDGDEALILPGLLLALAVGVVVGIANYALIRLLRIPPIIATLSSSFIVLSTAIWWNRGLRIKPPDVLAELATTNVWGIPILALVVIVVAVVMHVVLSRSVFGRSVTAIGQNARAAHLAGVRVERIRLIAYGLSGVAAALTGFLVASFSGGAALNMGEEYLLTTIAVVVIGGTSVAGGAGNVPGLWGAALFLFLLNAMLNTYGFGAGPKYILTGVIVILVIVVASLRRPPG
jgi:ribose transport system permease protein